MIVPYAPARWARLGKIGHASRDRESVSIRWCDGSRSTPARLTSFEPGAPPPSPQTRHSAGSYLRGHFGRKYVSVGLTLHRGSPTSYHGSEPYSVPEPPGLRRCGAGRRRWGPFLLGLHGEQPEEVRSWLSTRTRMRLIGHGCDADEDSAHHLSGGSPTGWFDVIAHASEATPTRPLSQSPVVPLMRCRRCPSAVSGVTRFRTKSDTPRNDRSGCAAATQGMMLPTRVRLTQADTSTCRPVQGRLRRDRPRFARAHGCRRAKKRRTRADQRPGAAWKGGRATQDAGRPPVNLTGWGRGGVWWRVLRLGRGVGCWWLRRWWVAGLRR
ncbi:erythromycin esterase family protein [Halosaccharopolyspora lacisalsi]|uniref:erythromycin esterase family protein n=1 Tax=Halosaccharopolyspora lacisalsi TaxID=1000566 RepID=UPI0015FA8BB2